MDTETIDGKAKMLCDSNSETLDMICFNDFISFIEKHQYYNSVNMFFNLKYDAQAILTYLDDLTLTDLHLLGKATYDDIKIQYIPKKKLSIRFNKKLYKFYDIFQFYYQSLNEASKRYFGEKKIDIDLTRINDPLFWESNYEKINKYCIKDSVLCRKLGLLAQQQYNELGLDFNNPISTASLSEQFAFRYRRVPTYSLPDMMEFGYFSYGGGWFEQFKRGYFPQITKLDINSAYPFVMSQLPDISEGYWELFDKNIDDCKFGFVLCKIRSKPAYIQPLQVSFKGSIKNPITDWHYRYITVDAYKLYLEHELCDIIPIDFALFYPRTDYKPFGHLASFYERRKFYKDQDDNRQQAFKILMNSLYGKTTQLIEINDEDWTLKAGQMFLPVYASYITDGTRLQVLKYILKHDIDPIAVYTDCIIAEDLPSVNDSRLGGWATEVKGEMLAIGCGVYSIRNGDTEYSHIRGFHKSSKGKLFSLTENNLTKNSIPMDIVRPLGLGEFIRNYKSTNENALNQWLEFPKQININFDTKRMWNDSFTNCSDLLSRHIDSRPIDLR